MADSGNFLQQMIGGSDLASTAFQTLVGAATGGFKGRPQWRDLQFMNDAQNRLWPDEIKRQGQFLEGLAPSQANAYNAYQNETYGEDTGRQVDRIKTMSSELGMSPWEITGAGGANPLPSPGSAGSQQGQGKMGEFLQGIMPLQMAKMQASTQLMTAKMQTDTQKYVADQQTGKGKLAISQIELQAAQKLLTDQSVSESLARVSSLNAQTDATQIGTVTNIIGTLAQLAPRVTVNLGPYSTTGIDEQSPLVQLGRELINSGPGQRDEKVAAYLNKLPPNQLKQVERDARRVAKLAVDMGGEAVGAVGKGIGDAVHAAGDFLAGMTNQKQ